MTAEPFCYWLQGRAELVSTPPGEAEWKCIREHLSTVFHKVTPLGPVQTNPTIQYPPTTQVPGIRPYITC